MLAALQATFVAVVYRVRGRGRVSTCLGYYYITAFIHHMLHAVTFALYVLYALTFACHVLHALTFTHHMLLHLQTTCYMLLHLPTTTCYMLLHLHTTCYMLLHCDWTGAGAGTSRVMTAKHRLLNSILDPCSSWRGGWLTTFIYCWASPWAGLPASWAAVLLYQQYGVWVCADPRT